MASFFMLSTFMEGVSATVMRLLAANLNNPFVGGLLQIIITVVLTTLLYVILRFIARRYNSADIKIFIPYLYILVLPCSFTVWIIRFGMGLDRVRLYPNKAPFAEGSPLWALVCILGAFATFFVILEVFAKALKIVNQETENALLAAQLREQRIYLSEAAKRAGQYRAFQHDINNHMLILSGLIKAEKYGQAQQYFDELNVTAGALASVVSTGSPVLDILLNEKIQYAAQNEILVSHIISLPKESTIDDIDLSVVFANALDNAINAAQKERPKDRSIDITARVKNQFLVIEITNPCHDIMPVKQGTGLKNILKIAKKYHGTADICKNADEFRVSVLLCWNMPLKRPFT